MVDDIVLVLNGYRLAEATREIVEAGVPDKYGNSPLTVLDTSHVGRKAFTTGILAIAANFLDLGEAADRIGEIIMRHRHLSGTLTACCQSGDAHVWAWVDGKQVIDGWESGLIREASQ